MLASGGYPWTIVRVQDRKPYLAALDRASIDMTMEPLAAFIAERCDGPCRRRKHKAFAKMLIANDKDHSSCPVVTNQCNPAHFWYRGAEKLFRFLVS
jgi:hypothetical protein